MSSDFVAVDHPPSTETLRPLVSDPARRPHPFRDGLPELTQRQVAYRVERLARVFRLGSEDAEDLRGTLVHEVYRAMPRHDPLIAKATTFAKGIMDIWYLQAFRELRKRLDLERRRRSLPEPGGEGSAFVAPRREPGREVGLRLDLEEALHRLPRTLRILAEELRTKTVAEIAAERRVHRGTVHRMLTRLREVLADLDPAVN